MKPLTKEGCLFKQCPKTIVDFVVRQGFGIINIGHHRAVWIAKEALVSRCPPGWIFIPDSTPNLKETIKQAMAHKID